MADLKTETVSFAANGSDCGGYLARLSDGVQRPGVVVIQEWWGVNDHIMDVARRFAGQGYVALAPDLYHGKVTVEPDEAGTLMMELNKEQAVVDVLGAVAHLKGITTGRIGVVGYCMGGMLTLMTAVKSRGIAAAAPYYGRNPDPIGQLASVTAPILAFYGENDQGVPASAAHALQAEMERHGKWVETHVYPGADHAFFNDTRPQAYSAAASTDAWSRTLAFFAEHLQPAPV